MNIDLKSVTKIIYNNQEITQLNDSNGNKLWPREAQWIDVFEGSKLVGPNSDYPGSRNPTDSEYEASLTSQTIYMPTGVSLDSNKTYEWVIDYVVLGGPNRLTASSTIDYRNNFKPNATGNTLIIYLYTSYTAGTRTYEPNIKIYYNRSSSGDYISLSGTRVVQKRSGSIKYGTGIQIEITKIQVREKS